MKYHTKNLFLPFLFAALAISPSGFGQPSNAAPSPSNVTQQATDSDSQGSQDKGMPLPFPESEGIRITPQDGTILWFSIQNHQFVLFFLNEKGKMIAPKVEKAKISYRQNTVRRSPSSGNRSSGVEVVVLTRSGNYLSSGRRIYPPYTFPNITILWSETEKLSFTYVKSSSNEK